VGPFYPSGTPPADFLGHYATQFDTVEADVTWYRIPDPRMVEGWRRKTPEGFKLAAKFPRSIVHGGDGARPDPERVLMRGVVERDLASFLGAMSLLGDRCGPLILQFPYFNKGVFPDAAPFLERLDDFLGGLPDTFRYGVEVRNKAWVGTELLGLLARHRAAFVQVDLSYLPHPADLGQRFDLITTDFTYCRLIGDRKAVDARTKTFDRVVLDQSGRLERWAELLKATLERVPEAYVYANNHYAGHGPATIRDLAGQVIGGPVAADDLESGT
jgi:uncharacterized protein YecE (DUF72 family)